LDVEKGWVRLCPLITRTGRSMRRIWLGAVVVAAFVTSVVPPAESSPPGSHEARVAEPSAAAFTGSRQVHLITGDTVRVMTRTDGVVVPTIVAGPHAGAPVARWSTGNAAYLMPRIPAAERCRVDASLFDVKRLAELHGRVPIVVTLNAHATATQLRTLSDEL